MASDNKFAQPSSGSWVSLRPGQEVRLRAQSSLYRDTYDCRVVTVSRTDLRVTMPMEHGKLVLIPVGTRVWVDADNESVQHSADAVVVDRSGGVERSLLLRSTAVESADEQPVAASQRLCRVVAVTSGKGGVGKSCFAVNFGAALTEIGLKAAIVDVDLGTANVDVLLNLAPRYNLSDVAYKGKSIFDVLVEGPRGLVVLPGGSGLQSLTELTDAQFDHVYRQFALLQQYVDVIVLDTGSGVSRSVTKFVLAADEAVLVTTPEPHAIVDAYALVKVLAAGGSAARLRLVINKVRDAAEANAIAAKMLFAGERFLQTNMNYLGFVVQDEWLDRAVRQQRLLVDVRAASEAAANFRRIAHAFARTLAKSGDEPTAVGGSKSIRTRPQTFLQRVRELFSR